MFRRFVLLTGIVAGVGTAWCEESPKTEVGITAAKEAFAAVARAVSGRDEQAFRECFRRIAQDKVDRPVLGDRFAETPEFTMIGFVLGSVQIQQVSSSTDERAYQPYIDRGNYWHVIGDVNMAKAPLGAEARVVRVTADIVRVDGHWYVVWAHAFQPFGVVDASNDSALHATFSVFRAIGRRDVSAIWSLTDPELRAGQTEQAFIAEADKRLAAVERWRTAQNDPAHANDPLRRAPTPYVCIDQRFTDAELDEEFVASDGAGSVRIWSVERHPYGAAPPRKLAFESFVQRDGKWYWRPRPEYTAWPLPANKTPDAVGSQPAARGRVSTRGPEAIASA